LSITENLFADYTGQEAWWIIGPSLPLKNDIFFFKRVIGGGKILDPEGGMTMIENQPRKASQSEPVEDSREDTVARYGSTHPAIFQRERNTISRTAHIAL